MEEGIINNCKKFALIGYPLGHSMSALIHKNLLEISKVKGEYIHIEVEPEHLKEEYEKKLNHLNGFNITIPHKTNIIQFLDQVSDKAKLYGSVNTVDIKNNKAVGYNTDCIGFLNSMKKENIEFGQNVLICGSGGVSRMFAFESLISGANVTLAVRNSSVQSAKNIQNEVRQKLSKDCKIIMLEDASDEYDLIINGTPVGMFPNVDACPIKEDVIKKAKAVFDAIYNPIETRLIKLSKKHGVRCLGGLPMLVWQAAVAEEIWNGVKFQNEDIDFVIDIAQKELRKKM